MKRVLQEKEDFPGVITQTCQALSHLSLCGVEQCYDAVNIEDTFIYLLKKHIEDEAVVWSILLASWNLADKTGNYIL